MTFVDIGAFSTCLALAKDIGILDDQLCLGILAFSTQDEFIDEYVEEVLQLFLVVCAVDDVTLGSTLADDFCLGTEFETKEFGDVDCGTGEVVGYVEHIGDDGFDAVAFPFDLS
jgi:hypothetical protein